MLSTRAVSKATNRQPRAANNSLASRGSAKWSCRLKPFWCETPDRLEGAPVVHCAIGVTDPGSVGQRALPGVNISTIARHHCFRVLHPDRRCTEGSSATRRQRRQVREKASQSKHIWIDDGEIGLVKSSEQYVQHCPVLSRLTSGQPIVRKIGGLIGDRLE